METIAIILEVVAFFMITTDLYGEARLEEFHRRITEKSPDIESEVRGRKESQFYELAALSRYQIPAFVMFVLVALAFFAALRFLDIQNPLRLHAIYLFISASIIYALYQNAMIIQGRSIAILWVMLQLVRLARWSLKRTRFSGLLLISGTILFLASKGLQIYAVTHHSSMEAVHASPTASSGGRESEPR